MGGVKLGDTPRISEMAAEDLDDMSLDAIARARCLRINCVRLAREL